MSMPSGDKPDGADILVAHAAKPHTLLKSAMKSQPSKGSHLYLLLILLALPFIFIAPFLAIRYFVNYRVHIFDPSNPSAGLPEDRTMQYQGQTIQLSKAYRDFDEYKNDPMNIAPAETARVQQLVTAAGISKSYPDREKLYAAISQIEFPGYGMSTFGERSQADGTILAGFSIEIPRANQERIIVYQLKGNGYVLLDDFVGSPEISEVRLQTGQLTYHDERGKLILTRPLQSK